MTEEKNITFNDVKDQTTEDYFEGNQFSIDAFNKKYRENKGETYVQAIWRVCQNIASVEETEELRKYWAERWFDEIYNDWWHPAGSIVQGAGSSRKISLANCTTISLGTRRDEEAWDNLESIIRNTEYTVAKCAAYRQGLGVDFSRIRPRAMSVNNSSSESQGAIHWMRKIDSNGYYVGQKGRIPAMLFSLRVDHPDIEEFITVKSDYTKIQNANISVQCTDGFYEAVEKDQDWNLRFEIPEVKIGDKVYLPKYSVVDWESTQKDSKGYFTVAEREREREVFQKSIKARRILELIAKNMLANAEPGIQNIDTAIRESNSDYIYDPTYPLDSRIVSTNACLPDFAMVLTPSGIKPLREIRIGSTIWTGSCWTKVINKWKTGVKEVFEFLSSSSTFVGTKDHRILSKGKKTEAGACEFIDIARGCPPETVCINLDDVMAGLLIGDGSYHDIPRLLNKFNLHIGSNDSDYFKSEVSHLIEKQSGNTTAWYVKTKLSKEYLPKTFNRVIPTEYYGGDSSKVCGFLRGLFSANGNVLLDGRVCLKQSSSRLIGQVREMLSSVGIKSYVTTNKSKNIKHRNGEYISKESYDLNITTDRCKFRDLIGFLQHYKIERLNKICDKPTRDLNNSYKILNTVPLGLHDVYEITVEHPDHVFWANGTLVSNCSEQYLNIEGLCVLSSINAGKFSIDTTNLKAELQKIGWSINRFLDNVNECELRNHTYATPNQKLSIEYLRRTGAGFTNLVGWLAKQGMEYGTPEGNKAASEFQRLYNYYLYKSSIELGKEKGSFKAFNKEKLEQSPFIQRMMAEGLKFEALRNITVSSIAPVGTLSLMFKGMVCSYGIEPAFGPYYWKRTRISGQYKYYFCVPRTVREAFATAGIPLQISSDTIEDKWDGSIGNPVALFIDENIGKTGLKIGRATDVSPTDKLDLMAKVATWVDSSMSTTYMLPEDSDWKDIYNFIIEAHKAGVKSVAAFPDKKMYGIVSYIPFKSLAEKLLNDKVSIHPQNFSEEERATLKLKAEAIERAVVRPPRPEKLPCDIHQVSVQGQKWVILIGMLNETPYEIFGGLAEYVQIPKKITSGILLKRPCLKGEQSISENCYDLYAGDEDDPLVIKNVSMVFQNKDFSLATRLASVSLGFRIPIETLIDQLKKDPGSTIVSFSRVMSRVLSKYVKTGDGGNESDDSACKSGNCE